MIQLYQVKKKSLERTVNKDKDKGKFLIYCCYHENNFWGFKGNLIIKKKNFKVNLVKNAYNNIINTT